jgi:hypothetical protein
MPVRKLKHLSQNGLGVLVQASYRCRKTPFTTRILRAWKGSLIAEAIKPVIPLRGHGTQSGREKPQRHSDEKPN